MTTAANALPLRTLVTSVTVPHAARARLGDVRASLEAYKAAARVQATEGSLAGALCTDGDGAAEVGKAVIERAAAQAKVEIADLRFAPLGTVARGVSASESDISARGQERPLMDFLANLDVARPVIFIDAIDMTSDGTMVSMQIKGRLLCRQVGRL